MSQFPMKKISYFRVRERYQLVTKRNLQEFHSTDLTSAIKTPLACKVC